MTLDLETARKSCNSCNRNAPSQTKLPPSARQVPNLPFQMIFADFFTLKGKNFLVFGDRLSGWTEVLRVNTRSGSKGLCEALRTVFSTFGSLRRSVQTVALSLQLKNSRTSLLAGECITGCPQPTLPNQMAEQR